MTTTFAADAARSVDALPRRRGVSCTQLNNGLWRITRDSGQVLGYVEHLEDGIQRRFHAKRLAASGRSFLAAGDFWSFDDAVDCLRFS